MVGPDQAEVLHVDAVVEHQCEGLGANSPVPIRFPDPISHLAVIVSDGDVARVLGEVSHCSDGLVRFLEHDGPCAVVVKDGADNLQTFLNGPVCRPSGAGPYVRVGGIFEKRFGIAVPPSAQFDSFCFHRMVV